MLKTIYENIPSKLKQHPQWVNWRGDTPQLREAVMTYETNISAPAKALLLTRTRLYHEANRVSGGTCQGKEVRRWLNSRH